MSTMTVTRFPLAILTRGLAVSSALCLCIAVAGCDAGEDTRAFRPPGGTATVSFDGQPEEMNAYYTAERSPDDPDGEGGRFAFLFFEGSAEEYAGFQRSIVLRHEALPSPRVRLWGIRDFDDTTEYFYGDVYLNTRETYRAELGAVRITSIEEEGISGVFTFTYGPSGESRIEASFTAVPYPSRED